MSEKVKPSYTYRATVLDVLDGDTMRVRFDAGFRVFVEAPLRLLGLNTPERRSTAGVEAATFVRVWFERNQELLVTTEKDPEKYGRWLGTVVSAGTGEVLNETLIANGLAVAWDGTGSRPLRS